MNYLITYVGADKGIPISANSPKEAFGKFLEDHPNFTDAEGNFYVVVESKEGKPLLEAGRNKSTGEVFCRPHPDL